MIITLKKNADKKQVDCLLGWLRDHKVTPHVSAGESETIIGCVGDVARLDIGLVQALSVVEAVQRIQEPYKEANRKFHPEDTVVDCSGFKVGGGNFQVIAGPCSVESEEQVLAIAKAVKAAGATMLRGGAFKPRTSPYSFQGLARRRVQAAHVPLLVPGSRQARPRDPPPGEARDGPPHRDRAHAHRAP